MSKSILKLLTALILLVMLSGSSLAQSLSKFQSADIGNPEFKGSTQFVKGGVDIKAGGEDIWMNSDQFHFVYEFIRGDFDFAARLESLERSNLYTKAGFMAREDLTPGSRNLMFLAFPGNDKRNNNRGGYEFQYRLETGKPSKAIYPSLTDSAAQSAFPVIYPNGWMRLKRVGNAFSAYTSTDGKNWKKYTEFQMEMPDKLYFGFAVTAHTKGGATFAKFRNFKGVK